MTERFHRRSVLRGGAAVLCTAAIAPSLSTAAELGKQRKVYVLVARKDGMTREAFVRHWLDIHAALASSVPGVLGFTGSELTSGTKPGEPSDYDGLAIIWYPDDVPNTQILGGSEGKAWLADGDTFISRERSTNLVGYERVYLKPAKPNGLYKQVWFLTRKPGDNREQFLAKLNAACTSNAKAAGLLGVALTELTVRPAGTATSGKSAPYEAVLETWWSSRQAAERAPAASPLFKAVGAAIDKPSSRLDLTLEHIALPLKA